MLLGHYAAGLAAKKIAPKTNLGALVAAGVFLDLIWPLFLLLGVEEVIIYPGNTVVTPLNFVSYPWSHSLLMSAVWGGSFWRNLLQRDTLQDGRNSTWASGCQPLVFGCAHAPARFAANTLGRDHDRI